MQICALNHHRGKSLCNSDSEPVRNDKGKIDKDDRRKRTFGVSKFIFGLFGGKKWREQVFQREQNASPTDKGRKRTSSRNFSKNKSLTSSIVVPVNFAFLILFLILKKIVTEQEGKKEF
jgi:hypothetical protein